MLKADPSCPMIRSIGTEYSADGMVGVSVGTSRHELCNRQEARRHLGQLLADAMALEEERIPTRKSRGHQAAKCRSRGWCADDKPE